MARTSIQNANASLYLSAAGSNVDCGTDIIGTGNVTVMGWIKLQGVGGSSAGRIFDNGKFGLFVDSVATQRRIRVFSDGISGTITTGSLVSAVNPNSWVYIAVTRSSTGLVNHYIQSTLSGSADQSSSTPAAATTNLFMGNRSDLTRNFNGLLSNFAIVPRICTQAEIQAHMNQSIIPTGATAVYPFTEGAGSIAYDTSGNGNDGTITSGTWSRDTPSKTRKKVNGNLVYNGDFEIAPVVNVATTTSSRFIDGTSGGSTTNSLFGWYISLGGTSSVVFDSAVKYSGTYSLRLSTLATSSYALAFVPKQDGTAATYFNKVIPVQPNTAYTVTYRMKTDVVSGTSDGASVIVYPCLGDGTTAGGNTSGTQVSTTTDWTQYSISLTTGSTVRFLQINPRVHGHIGTGTLIMDAWFDDITLTPTIPTTRTATTGPYRNTVENLLANGDFEYAPAFTAATNTANRYIDGTAAGLNANESPYKWFAPGTFANATAQYDTSVELTGTASMKLSTTTTAGLASALYGNNTSATNIKLTMIPVLPSTSYTVSGYCKTNNVAAAAAHIDIYEYDGTGTVGATNTTNTLTGTNDWTLVTVTFTTASTARYLALALRNHVAGNISDAWFDDIKLTKTTPDARSAA